jgi:hypothetical protein
MVVVMSSLPRRLKPGDRVYVQALTAVDLSDPALVVLQADNGARLKVGRLAVVPTPKGGKTP